MMNEAHDVYEGRGAAGRYFREVVLNYEGDECLPWPFYRTHFGYPQVSINSKTQIASRVLCTMAHGEPPSSKHHAAHSCGGGRAGCVNKRHLSWKTATENQADRIAHGTEYHGEQHHKARLTAIDVLAIKALSGILSQRAIADQFGVTQTSIWSIVNGRNWKHLNGGAQL